MFNVVKKIYKSVPNNAFFFSVLASVSDIFELKALYQKWFIDSWDASECHLLLWQYLEDSAV